MNKKVKNTVKDDTIALINLNVSLLQEDVVQVREELTNIKQDIKKIKTDMVDMEDRLTNKLDKILDVVSDKQAATHLRLTQLEHHTEHPPLAAMAV